MKKISILSLCLLWMAVSLQAKESILDSLLQNMSTDFIQISPEKSKEQIFINRYEVSNLLYGEFLAAIKMNDIFYEKCLYDQSQWQDANRIYDLPENVYQKTKVNASDCKGFLKEMNALSTLDIHQKSFEEKTSWKKNLYQDYLEKLNFSQLYHTAEAYVDYPVVNIDYDAVLAFCKWLTSTYNNSPQKKHTKVIFRLPTKREWKIAAMPFNNKDNPWAAKKSFDDFLYRPMPVNSFLPNEKGFYHLEDNVAEMLSEKGFIQVKTSETKEKPMQMVELQTFEEADPRIGFRLVMEVLE